MVNIKTVSVYCGSSLGKEKIYMDKAIELGEVIIENKMNLVYGGGNIGLMGAIANTVLQKGGRVTGVLPHFLNKKEVGNLDVNELILVESMHERKKKISDLSDAFIAMPGGFGTLEEVAEMLTWTQLGLSRKPIGVLNVNGYYNNLLAQFDTMVDQGFLKKENRKMLVDDPEPSKLITKMREFTPIDTPRWMQSSQT